MSLLGAVLEFSRSATWRSDEWSFLRLQLFLVAVFALPVWVLLLLPLYVLLPRTSRLWSAPICTALGAGCGVGILALFFSAAHLPLNLLCVFGLEAAVVGGSTCLFGTLTARYFHDARMIYRKGVEPER